MLGKGSRGPTSCLKVQGQRWRLGNQRWTRAKGGRARAAPQGVGREEGPPRVGEGRSRASHNNQSQPLPTPTSKPQAPCDPGCTHSDRGSCGPQAAAASAGGASVARSVPAARLRRVPPRAPAATPPLPVPLPLRQMASGSPAPPCLASAWLPTAHFPSQPALAARRPGGLPRPTRFPALFSALPSFCM